MLRFIGITFLRGLVTLIGLLIFIHVVEWPEEYTQQQVQDYRDRMIEIVNATEGCHDSGTYTSHFEQYDLANDVLRNLSEEGLLDTEIEGGGFFGRQETVYCPANSLEDTDKTAGAEGGSD
jgi:hypothetical protein